MSLNHLFEQASVKRNVPKVACFDEVESIKKNARFIQSQQNLEINNRYQVIYERLQKKRLAHRAYYQEHAQTICAREREIYHSSEENRRKKSLRTKQWQAKNRDKARSTSKAWQANNRERRNASRKKYYENLKQRLTPEEFTAWNRARTQKAIQKKISAIGYEEYRKLENARLKAWRDKPENIERQRAKSRERSRQIREKIKASPQALEKYKAYQAQYQRNRRAKLKAQKEQA